MNIFKKKKNPNENNARVEAGQIVVLREDYFTTRKTLADYYAITDYSYGLPGFFKRTYKEAYEQELKRVVELETFLEDLATLDPQMAQRFSAIDEGEGAELSESFAWDFKGAHAAADLLRSDADETVKRDAIKKFRGK